MWLWIAWSPETHVGATSPSSPSTALSSPLPPTDCQVVSTEERGYVPPGSSAEEELPACTAAVHPSSGAAGSLLSLTLSGTSATVTDFAGNLLAGPGATGTFEVVPQRSGEIFVTLEDLTEDGAYSLSVSCTVCEREWTRYPLLLMHGLGGSDAFGGVEYFYGVPSGLRALGVEVEAPAVSPFAPPAERALEWEIHLDALLAQGHRRVNLVGHSLGGLDARVMASPGGLARAEHVASVTTIGTPHQGTEIADLLQQGLDQGVLDPDLLDVGASLFALLFGVDPADPAFADAIASLTSEQALALDSTHPDAPETLYWSWAGRSCGVLEPWCQSELGGEVVDPLLAASYLLLWPRPNDGLVLVESQAHGVLLGELPADHADEIGQVEDDDNTAFDHRQFYLDEVRRLRAAGL
jgi:triacylglycerol lipase